MTADLTHSVLHANFKTYSVSLFFFFFFEDDEACAAALQKGCVFLFHRLSPLLQQTGKATFRPASALQRLGADQSLLDDSVLIGCSEHNQAQFCLDVGKNKFGSATPEGSC
uniref:NADH pyrophosphatase-like N-terminal domain-containing protein n=1 Tax=Salarias fasciatus TaxID=181472 RepID=A0A672FBB6_SALFA